MSSTFSSLKFELIGTGEQSGTWGNTTNTNIGTAIEQAIVGMATLDAADFTANVCTLTLANVNTAQDARALCLNIAAGAVSAAGTVNVPAIQKPYVVINSSSYAVTVKVTGQTGVTVPAGLRTVVYNDGTDIGAQVTFLTALALGTALPVTSGGTGATTASGARSNLSAASSGANSDITSLTGLTTPLSLAQGGTAATSASTARTSLGATTVGANLFTLANPSAITFVRLNADNTVTALDAASFRSAIGAGTGSGSVTSVAGTGSVNGISLSGTVTTTGNLTLGGTLSGVSLTSQVTGTLPIANGGTGNVNGTVAKLATSNFTIEESGGKLVVKYGATTVLSIASNGALISANNLSGFTTP